MKKYFVFVSLLLIGLYVRASQVDGNGLRPILVPIEDVHCPQRDYATLQTVFSQLSTQRLNQIAFLCVRENTWGNKKGLAALGTYMHAVENPKKYTFKHEHFLYWREHQLVDADGNIRTD